MLKIHTALSCILLVIAMPLADPAVTQSAGGLTPGTSFHYNQIGYLPQATKLAVISEALSDDFLVLDDEGKVVYTGILSAGAYWDKAGQTVRTADFTALTLPGTYRLQCGTEMSGSFEISENVYVDLVRGSAKYYYYNRASTALPEEFAGEYHRPFAHPDTSSLIHQTAATASRPAGMQIRTEKGWYDAGDYNKYIVNSGITTFTLMRAYEENKELFDTLTWNIPESNNQVPDLLDEIRWNLEWMITMQDPDDGGVYHKNTTANFEGFVPPHEATSTRYVIQKSTTAALDFAAVLARASRLYKASDPEFSNQMIRQAEAAWEWAIKNPDVLFRNPGDSGRFGPAIATGAYGDRNVQDEFFWAAAELYLTTRKQVYLDTVHGTPLKTFRVPSWGSVETLGLIALSSDLPENNNLRMRADQELMKVAIGLHQQAEEAPYQIPLNDFRWGSSSDILNQGMVLMQAWRISGEEKFRADALSCLDYVLGRNAPGVSFVTGFGNETPLYPHHRPSASDNVENPVPGMLAGGPNPHNMDQDCGRDHYPDHHPAMAYIDEECSYSTNEVAINWNAPLVYLSASVQTSYAG